MKTKHLFEYKEIDKRFYEERIRDFLPEKFIDVHTHIWARTKTDGKSDNRSTSWPTRVADQCLVEELIGTYKTMFPGKKVTPLVFSGLPERDKLDSFNSYVETSALKNNLPSLIFSDPSWTKETLEKKIISGKYSGAKSYLSLAPENIATEDITIYDFFPKEHFEVFNKLGLVVMLHIPRKKRLSDPINISQLIEIEKNFPDVKLIVAHVGRSYCLSDIGDAFEKLSVCEKMLFDISANTNEFVFEELFKSVGPKRILFGSDMPITRMRMRRIERNASYVNIVPKGLYGDVSGDPNMMEADGDEAEKLSFFIYEEIAAFKRAAEKTSLSKSDIEDVFYNNSRRILKI